MREQHDAGYAKVVAGQRQQAIEHARWLAEMKPDTARRLAATDPIIAAEVARRDADRRRRNGVLSAGAVELPRAPESIR